ncbi:hypothetical protein [Actinoplanes sp. NPDC089786]|uniref:hypothetical protein n=1 Tax=Actinoplanes sp. NPDC089786 TaxID=3155185 RepID=UPI0034279C8E
MIDQPHHCPHCATPLSTAEFAEPWCGGCEWNLARMPVAENVGWVLRRMLRWDGEAGFRADRALVRSGDLEAGRPHGFRLLVAISAALLAGSWLPVRSRCSGTRPISRSPPWTPATPAAPSCAPPAWPCGPPAPPRRST